MAPVPNPRKSLGKSLSAIIVLDDYERVSITIFKTSKVLSFARKVASGKLDINEEASQQAALDSVVGLIAMEENSRCDAYEIKNAAADRGYGPGLYDVAMTFAQRDGYRGVTPDRDSVSPDAERVWQYSLTRRSDIEATPLRGLLCGKHRGRDALNYVYGLKKPFKSYAGLLDRGRDLVEQLKDIFADDPQMAYHFLNSTRQMFWICKYGGFCPGPFPGAQETEKAGAA